MLLALFLLSIAAAGTLAALWGGALFGRRVRAERFVPPPAHHPMRIPALPSLPSLPSRLARGTTPQPILDTTPSVIVEPLAMRVPPPRAPSSPSASRDQIPRSN